MSKRVGALTIGQTPRQDITPVIRAALPDTEIVEAGVLDGYSAEELSKLHPGIGDHVLVTRLQAGRQIILSREKILEAMQRTLDRLGDQVEVIVLLCGAEFPTLQCVRPLIRPDRVVRAVVESLPRRGALGLVIPLVSQVVEARKRWAVVTESTVVATGSPYQQVDFLKLGASLAEQGAEIIVLDGMAYTPFHRRLVAEGSRQPTILPVNLVAAVLREFM